MKEMTEIAKATALLCTNLGLKSKEFTPYTSIQWHGLATKIYNSCYKTPDKLIGEDEQDLCVNLGVNQPEAHRIYGLLSRGYSFAFSLEELDQRGIGIITKSDKEYPQRLEDILGSRHVPPVLFYCGDFSLCNMPGIAIVGSRNIDNEGSMCAGMLAKEAAMHGLAVYSGGARGVDSISRENAIAAGGVCVEFVADSMQRKIQSREYREAINAGSLLVLSVVRPDAGFNVANAMNRNKFVYALAQRAFVIASDKGKGGTWAGAKESMSKKYVPVSVWKNAAYAGNNELIKLGAEAFDNVSAVDFANLNSIKQKSAYEQVSLFTDNMEAAIIAESKEDYSKQVEAVSEDLTIGNGAKDTIGPAAISVEVILDANVDQGKADIDESQAEASDEAASIYELVLPVLKKYFQTEKHFDTACVELEVEKGQLKKWLDKAEEQGVLRKFMRPKRYIIIS